MVVDADIASVYVSVRSLMGCSVAFQALLLYGRPSSQLLRAVIKSDIFERQITYSGYFVWVKLSIKTIPPFLLFI